VVDGLAQPVERNEGADDDVVIPWPEVVAGDDADADGSPESENWLVIAVSPSQRFG